MLESKNSMTYSHLPPFFEFYSQLSFLHTSNFRCRQRAICFDIFRMCRSYENSVYIVPLCLIIQTRAVLSERSAVRRHRPTQKQDWHSVKTLEFGICPSDWVPLRSGRWQLEPTPEWKPPIVGPQMSFDLSATLTAIAEPPSHTGSVSHINHIVCCVQSKGSLCPSQLLIDS